MTTMTAEPPTLSRWAEAHRFTLRRATRATRSQRTRSQERAADAVLGYVLASLPPARVSVSRIAAHTGLTVRQVADTIADLEHAGRLENGASHTGRLGVLVPSVLAALGLDGWGLPLDFVRADVVPAGTHVEVTDDELTAAFAS